MHSFTDANGKTWLIEINPTNIKRLDALAGLEVHITPNYAQLYRALFAVCTDNNGQRPDDEAAFDAALAGCTLAAFKAYVAEVNDFFAREGILDRPPDKSPTQDTPDSDPLTGACGSAASSASTQRGTLSVS